MVPDEALFWIGIFLVGVHLFLFFSLLVRLKKLYPSIWQGLGSPTFFPTSTWSDSVFGMKVIKFIFSVWPQQIIDGFILSLRNIVRVTTIIGVVYFLLLMILGVFMGK